MIIFLSLGEKNISLILRNLILNNIDRPTFYLRIGFIASKHVDFLRKVNALIVLNVLFKVEDVRTIYYQGNPCQVRISK